MTPVLQTNPKAITEADLNHLARQAGPCITLQVPAYRPGDGAGSRQTLLRDLAHEAVSRLRDLHRSGDAIASMERLISMVEEHGGGPAMILFAAPEFEAIFNARTITHPVVTVGSRFRIVPVLAEAMAPREFYILGLSKKHVRLLRYGDGRCEELPLPPGVPPNLEAAGAFDAPDHDLQNRSTGGPTTASGLGGTRRVRFGTGTGRETEVEYVHLFLMRIDQGLKETIRDKPLFLAGVREELTEFRKVSKHAYIFEQECLGNPDRATPEQMADHAFAGALREYYAAAARAAQAVPEQALKIVGDGCRIFKAAQEGRVRRLLLAEQATIPAHAALDGGSDGEDLINASAVETIRTGGEVYAVTGTELPALGAIAALLRF